MKIKNEVYDMEIKGDEDDIVAVAFAKSGNAMNMSVHGTPPQEAIKLTCKAVTVGVNDLYKDIDAMLMKQEVQ